ncbi:hypothetical protein GCM10014715_39350 [Streptomyces spiralis]|uniref:Uncharacterized protein n=1 Tax=Streptomyces spiralis TaxID=66376 RepID=A0A919DUC7_9ACTN|nr:hypothetical protein [Streptomyces spiralis]GHE80114.1 hypothetical protein GCM10014715_39350 [Streptomyces spiralis]
MSTPPIEEATPTMMQATCHTPGCPVEDVTYTVAMYPCSVPPTWRAVCAQCGQAVTDIVPV